MVKIEAHACEEYARVAAFLWQLRDRAVHDAAHDLETLSRLDERLEAHLDGLRLAGGSGLAACEELLADAHGGEVFGAAVAAIDGGSEQGLARVLAVGGDAHDLARGLASALGWTPFDRVEHLLPDLLSSQGSPALTWVGIAACALHRRDPGTALGHAIVGKDPRVRARALRAAGEIGRIALLPQVREAMGEEDDACRFWAAWSAALFGEAPAVRTLREIATGAGPFAERAASMVVRRMDPSAARGWVEAATQTGCGLRLPIGAAAALGDPALGPWLIECMRVQEMARLAGGALTLITGVNLRAEGLSTHPPKGARSGPTDDPEDEDVAMDPDESLPWPDATKVSEWWQRHKEELKPGVRHLLGKPMLPEWLEAVLLCGSQPARAAAAIELGLRQPGRPVFEIRAPGFRQRRTLGAQPKIPQWSSGFDVSAEPTVCGLPVVGSTVQVPASHPHRTVSAPAKALHHAASESPRLSSPEAREVPPGHDMRATAHLNIHQIVSRLPPFQPPAPSLDAAIKERPPSALPPIVRLSTRPQTAALDMHRLSSRVLPFAEQPKRPQSSPSVDASAVPGVAGPPVTGGVAQVPAASAPATATHHAASAGAPRFTLEQYASLTAELCVWPGSAAAIYAKYQIFSVAAWQLVQREWHERFVADASLHARWLDLSTRYRNWLLRRVP